jgi:alkylation response protein AidB-like acyl-CoA dehydrogenase
MDGSLVIRDAMQSRVGDSGEAYGRVALLAHQIFGAIGFTMDHDIHLYYRQAKAGKIIFGDVDFQHAIVARELGL